MRISLRAAMYFLMGVCGCVLLFTPQHHSSRIGALPHSLPSHRPSANERQAVVDYLIKEKAKFADVHDPLTGESYYIGDWMELIGGKLQATRYISDKPKQRYWFTSSRLRVPEDLSWRTADSSLWPVDHSAVTTPYLQHFIVRTFAAGSLLPSSPTPQPVLVLGLGGGKAPMFMKQLGMNISVSVVELSATMVSIARDWFGVVEDEHLQIHLRDGVQYLRQAAVRGDQYASIQLDASYNGGNHSLVCPAPVFLQDDVIADMARVLHFNGTLVVNILSRAETRTKAEVERGEEEVLTKFGKHLKCELYNVRRHQKNMMCSHRGAISSSQHFTANMNKFQQLFGFNLTVM